MVNYKIINKILYISDIYGNILRKIIEGVSFATYDDAQALFLVTRMDGKVETREINGNFRRLLGNSAYEARFSGTDVIIRKRDGVIELRDRNGNIIRYL
jgi:hypothetical protein